MERMNCISAEVYRSKGGDCSNGGLSSWCNTVLVPHDAGPIVIDRDNPPKNLCRVVRRNIFGREYVHVEPYDCGGRHAMYGGTLVDTSDSRFTELINNGGYPVKLMDRFE